MSPRRERPFMGSMVAFFVLRFVVPGAFLVAMPWDAGCGQRAATAHSAAIAVQAHGPR